MKTSNKILLGGLAFLLIAGIALAAFTRSQTVFLTDGDCNELPRKKSQLDFTFDGIEASSNIRVTVLKGDFSVEVESTEEVVPFLNHHVDDGILRLGFDRGEYTPCPVNYTLRCPSLKSVTASSGARVIAEGQFSTPSIKLNTNSAGRIEIDVVSDNVEARATSAGSIKMSGDINSLVLNASSSGSLDATGAEIDKSTFRMSSAASATVKTDTILKANLSSSASLRYIGSAQMMDISTNSAGSIKRVSEN